MGASSHKQSRGGNVSLLQTPTKEMYHMMAFQSYFFFGGTWHIIYLHSTIFFLPLNALLPNGISIFFCLVFFVIVVCQLLATQFTCVYMCSVGAVDHECYQQLFAVCLASIWIQIQNMASFNTTRTRPSAWWSMPGNIIAVNILRALYNSVYIA